MLVIAGGYWLVEGVVLDCGIDALVDHEAELSGKGEEAKG